MDTQNQENKPKSSSFKNVMKVVWELLQIGIIAFLIVMPIRYFLFQPFIVSGESMVPNFHNGDYLIVDEISYRLSTPQRGDVIIFNTNFIQGYKGQRFIKRIIGLPGETVEVKDGNVYVTDNGKKFQLSEKYLPASLKTYGPNGAAVNTTLKGSEYFVLGDNREQSYDSRFWGVVPRKEIIGKAFLRIFPIAALSAIPQPAY